MVNGAAFAAASSSLGGGAAVRPLRARTGRPVHIPDQLLVKLRPGIQTAQASPLHAQVGATVLRTIARLDVQVVRIAPGVSAGSAMAAYRVSGLVEYVEQDAYAYASAIPNDPLYGNQSWHYSQIFLPTAWDTAIGSPVIVAVLDTGIRTDHPDLAGITVQGFDFFANPDDSDPTDEGCPTVDPTDLSHGTHVSGTVAARTNNTLGVAGVNWGGAAGTRIMAIRVLGEIPPLSCGSGSLSDVASGIIYAADQGARVINMSLGGAISPCTFLTVDNAISYARSLGVTLAAASGNFNTAVEYPACNPNVIAVGATINTSPPTRASYSNFGPELDVVAPGGNSAFGVWSTTWGFSAGNTYQPFMGTSMATPHVAGLIALMIGRGITSPVTIQSMLQTTAMDLAPPGFDPQTGFGLVNAAAAVGGGSGPTRMCAFSGVISSLAVTRQSSQVAVAANGAFTIINAESGVKTVFVWQDMDGSGTVTPGDIYGETPGVAIFPGQTTSGVTVTVQTRGASSTTLTVSGGAAACP
ncbi:MAG: S8 family serine peptidase [bacterium]